MHEIWKILHAIQLDHVSTEMSLNYNDHIIRIVQEHCKLPFHPYNSDGKGSKTISTSLLMHRTPHDKSRHHCVGLENDQPTQNTTPPLQEVNEHERDKSYLVDRHEQKHYSITLSQCSYVASLQRLVKCTTGRQILHNAGKWATALRDYVWKMCMG